MDIKEVLIDRILGINNVIKQQIDKTLNLFSIKNNPYFGNS